LGQPFSQDEITTNLNDKFVLNDFVADERGLIAWQTFGVDGKGDETIYYTEEVLGMILKYGRELSEK
jgi:hypothetical protein